jgi:serine phosphatase RsbU (regulator of sigma subunit)
MFSYNKSRLFARIFFVNIVFLVVSYLGSTLIEFEYFIPLILLVNLGMNYFLLSMYYFKPLRHLCSQVAAVLAGKDYSKINFKTTDEFGLLGMFFNQVTSNIEKVSTYLKEGSRMASELALARDIQKSVLPTALPVVPGLDIVSKTRPAEEVGGDSFDIEMHNEEYYFYIGDVTGHGAPAGLVMMMVNTLFDVFLSTVSNTKELAVKVNNTLKPRVNSTLFMTTSFFRWNPVDKKMFYTGCGHENIIIYRAAEGISEVTPAGGIALAMADDIETIVAEKEIILNDQDIMVLYSDGITEAVASSGELYGLERLKLAVNKFGHLGDSLNLFEALSKEVQEFVGDALQKDDMTLFVIRKSDVVSANVGSENLVSTKWNV